MTASVMGRSFILAVLTTKEEGCVKKRERGDERVDNCDANVMTIRMTDKPGAALSAIFTAGAVNAVWPLDRNQVGAGCDLPAA